METVNENELARTESTETSGPDDEYDAGDDEEVNMGEVNSDTTRDTLPSDIASEMLNAPTEEARPQEPEENIMVLPPQILNPATLAVRRESIRQQPPPTAPARMGERLGNRQTNLVLGSAQRNQAKSGRQQKSSLFSRLKTGAPKEEDNSNQNLGYIEVSWRDLSYKVERSEWSPGNCFTATDGRSCMKTTRRTILNELNGYFRTGHLTAVMGPSGSGKSTMLECVVGLRKRGVSGEVRVNGAKGEQKIKVALINQRDYLMEAFTVREMLVYASRLKNPSGKLPADEIDEDEDIAPLEEVVATSGLEGTEVGSSGNLIEPKAEKNLHQRVAIRIVKQLGLEVCIDTRAGNCSGGQKKRISIALEMISKPNILILDEPTSGLDSSACYQTVALLQRLTKMGKNSIAVVATIHQPSARVFNLFDHVYILSYNGHCIYEGSVPNLLPNLASVELICPQFHNPADFIAEVASGEHGIEPVESLIRYKQNDDRALTEHIGNSRSLTEYSEMASHPIFSHLWILYERCTLMTIRDPMLNTLRLLSHVATAVFIGILYGPYLGAPSLCPPIISPLNDLENFPAYRQEYQRDVVTSTENLAFIFFMLMFNLFGSMMPTIMAFPSQMFILRKEKINGWYSLFTYFLAMSVSEIPFQIFFPSVFVIIAYVMTGQIMSPMRIALFLLINILMAFIAQSQGLLMGAIFMEDPSAAVFLGPISTVPLMLFGGFFVRLSTIPSYLYYFSFTSYMRFAFEASLTVLYGFDRCVPDPELLKLNVTEKPGWMAYATAVLGENGDKFIDSFARTIGGTFDPASGKKYRSSLLDQYEVDEDDFWLNIGILFLFFLVLRILTYIVFNLKIKKSD